MATHMKTTIDINDELFRSARQRANETGTTFRALVEEGLRQVLASGPPAVRAPFVLPSWAPENGEIAGLAPPYDRLGLHQAVLDSYREFDFSDMPIGAVHDRD